MAKKYEEWKLDLRRTFKVYIYGTQPTQLYSSSSSVFLRTW